MHLSAAFDPERLAAMLRGTSHVPTLRPAEPEPPRGLPKAAALWREQHARLAIEREREEAQALEAATTPSATVCAWIDGELHELQTPDIATTPRRVQEAATAREEPLADTETPPAPADAATGPHSDPPHASEGE